MPEFYVNRNKQYNGDNEVHQNNICPYPANVENRVYLGIFPSCSGAVREAKNKGYNANGCKYCAPACHTR